MHGGRVASHPACQSKSLGFETKVVRQGQPHGTVRSVGPVSGGLGCKQLMKAPYYKIYVLHVLNYFFFFFFFFTYLHIYRQFLRFVRHVFVMKRTGGSVPHTPRDVPLEEVGLG